MPENAGNNERPAIKVLLVDDSQIALTLFKRMLAPAKDIIVVGMASNGKEALDIIPKTRPALICTDLHMPVMDGFELTKAVMELFPMPILVVSVSVKEGSKNVFNVLEAGAVDIFQKPRGGTEADYLAIAGEFQRRIRIVAGVHVFKRFRQAEMASDVLRITAKNGFNNKKAKAVVIGASTGGPQALQALFSRLPSDFPLPIVCVQHIENGFLGGFIDWLRESSRMKVAIAVDGEVPQPGCVYFPPEGRHLVIDNSGRFVCLNENPLNGHRPSITVTLKSAAERFGSGVIGVLLTGMGSDGAEGMKAVAEAGGVTIAQNEKTSVVFSMPMHAIELGAADFVLPIDEIPLAIITQTAIKMKSE